MPEYRDKDDSLRGDRIAVSVREISQTRVKHRSGSHKGQFATMRDNAFCIIEIPLKVVVNKTNKK